MGYYLQALICKSQSLKNEAKSFLAEHRISLAQDFTMIVVTEELCEEVADNYLCDENNPYKEFLMLSGSLAAWAKEISKLTPIAYLEAEYFGGVGRQSAIVWHKGSFIFGPLSGEIGPINKALQLLGAQAVGAQDEFDSIGLNRKRNTEDWIEISKSLN
jgi:hypothetical protein